MDTPETIQALADARITEAECLYTNGHYNMAFYVAGYAVELYFKAKICITLNIPNFFDFGNRDKFANEDNITKPYRVHNYGQLAILSGLLPEYYKMLDDADFKDAWLVLSQWKEDLRYTMEKRQTTQENSLTALKSLRYG